MITPPPEAPVDLVRPGVVEQGASIPWLPMIAVGVGLVVLAVIATILVRRFRPRIRVPEIHVPRIRLAPSPEWRAAHDLSRELGLTHRHRAALSRLSRLTDAPPVAMMLSEHALDTALARLDLRAIASDARPDERVIAELRQRIFAEPVASAEG